MGDVERYPRRVEYRRNGALIFEAIVYSPSAYLPPVPESAAVILTFADGTVEVLPAVNPDAPVAEPKPDVILP